MLVTILHYRTVSAASNAGSYHVAGSQTPPAGYIHGQGPATMKRDNIRWTAFIDMLALRYIATSCEDEALCRAMTAAVTPNAM